MKRLYIILFAFLLLFIGCGKSEEQSFINKSEILDEYLSNLDILESPTREYGENTGYVQFDNDLMVRILYPEGDLKSLDIQVSEWVDDTIDMYKEDSKGSSESGDSAELTAEYESYVVNDEVVSVKLYGIYDRPYNAHPIDIIKTFHANNKTGELIELNDILVKGGLKDLIKMVVADAGLEKDTIDDKLLDNWTLTSDRLEIILERGAYLPMSDGTVTLNYSMDELEGIIDISGKLKEDAENVPSEQPLPTEEPATEEPAVTEPDTQTVDPDKPMVALTFDDGPSKHTERLLDIFVSNGGKGTFFVVGNLIESRKQTVKRIVDEEHEIGGHSWSHRQLTKLSIKDMTKEIMNTRAMIYSVTGKDTTIMRPPYGSFNDETREVCRDNGVVMINWSLDTLDWKNKDADKVYKTIMKDVKDGDIILCHDLHETTVDAMERVIPDLIAKGYQLVTVSELLACGDYEINPGSVHTKR